jgi:hypothetical protein
MSVPGAYGTIHWRCAFFGMVFLPRVLPWTFLVTQESYDMPDAIRTRAVVITAFCQERVKCLQVLFPNLV